MDRVASRTVSHACAPPPLHCEGCLVVRDRVPSPTPHSSGSRFLIPFPSRPHLPRTFSPAFASLYLLSLIGTFFVPMNLISGFLMTAVPLSPLLRVLFDILQATFPDPFPPFLMSAPTFPANQLNISLHHLLPPPFACKRQASAPGSRCRMRCVTYANDFSRCPSFLAQSPPAAYYWNTVFLLYCPKPHFRLAFAILQHFLCASPLSLFHFLPFLFSFIEVLSRLCVLHTFA